MRSTTQPSRSPLLACASSLLFLSTVSPLAHAAQTVSTPVGIALAEIQTLATPAMRDAVIAHEEITPTRNAPPLAQLVNCRLLQWVVPGQGSHAAEQWVITPDAQCADAADGKAAWLVADAPGMPRVLLADHGNTFTLNTGSDGAALAEVLVYRTLVLPPTLAERIPFQHQSPRCANVWQFQQGKYHLSGQTAPMLLVNDPVAGGWVEMPLSHYLPDIAATLCQTR